MIPRVPVLRMALEHQALQMAKKKKKNSDAYTLKMLEQHIPEKNQVKFDLTIHQSKTNPKSEKKVLKENNAKVCWKAKVLG